MRWRLWDLHDQFRNGRLQPRYLTRHLALIGGELLDGLPQRAEILMHLLRVEGGSSGGRRRSRRWRDFRKDCAPQLPNFARDLVLTVGEMVRGLPQRG
jgi:hypothetical protein